MIAGALVGIGLVGYLAGLLELPGEIALVPRMRSNNPLSGVQCRDQHLVILPSALRPDRNCPTSCTRGCPLPVTYGDSRRAPPQGVDMK